MSEALQIQQEILSYLEAHRDRYLDAIRTLARIPATAALPKTFPPKTKTDTGTAGNNRKSESCCCESQTETASCSGRKHPARAGSVEASGQSNRSAHGKTARTAGG